MNLDFSARNSSNNGLTTSLFHSLGIQPNGFDLGATRVKAEGNSNFKYHLTVEKTNGDDTFCKRLKIKVLTRSFFGVYSGSLSDLSITSSFTDFDPKDFIFFINLNEATQSLRNKICEFNFDFRTYRNDPNERNGIFAERKISNVISSGSW